MELMFFLLNRRVDGFRVGSGSLQDFSRNLRTFVEKRKSYCVYFVSLRTLRRAGEYENGPAALSNADLLIPGSDWLARSLRRHLALKAQKISRKHLTDVLLEALPWNMVCFYGEDNRQLRSLTRQYPEITAITRNEKSPSADSVLNRAGFSLVFVCLPEGEQLRWMNEMKGKVKACMVGLGDGSSTWF